MSFLKDQKRAEMYIKRATHLSTEAMLDHDKIPETIEQYKILLMMLEHENENIQFLFALSIQERTSYAVEIYNRMGPKSEEMMLELLPENLTMTVLCYETVGEKLGSMTNERIKFLRDEFNKLPVCHPQNPKKTFDLYKKAYRI